VRIALAPDPHARRRRLLGGAAIIAIILLACQASPALTQPAGIAPVPPGRVESPPPRSATERLAWQPGHWDWSAAEERYIWRPGRQIIRRPGATRYEPGRWVQSGGQWSWRRARWR
jgi:hypothetical protein